MPYLMVNTHSSSLILGHPLAILSILEQLYRE
jgi:23S rRNA pseudoU1915 N3-methylase RlmH